MKTIATLLTCTFCLSLTAHECDMRYTAYTVIRTGSATTITLTVYAGCYVESYPYLEVKRKSDGMVIGRGDISSFGQPEESFDEYSVTLDAGQTLRMSELDFVMVSAMDRERHAIIADTVSNEDRIGILKVKPAKDGSYLSITLDRKLRWITVTAFCDVHLFLKMDMSITSEPQDKIILPLNSCDSKRLWLWVEGFPEEKGKNKQVYLDGIVWGK